MQEKLTIARPYAAAAFSYAVEHGEVDTWSEMLRTLAAAMCDPALIYFSRHPKVSDAELLSVLGSILGTLLTTSGRNFLQALLDAERLDVTAEIGQLFERHRAQAAGQIKVEVTSAFPLNAAERNKIDTAMRARLGKDCKIEATLDPALIGGAIIKIGDSVIDLSLRGRLSALAQQLH